MSARALALAATLSLAALTARAAQPTGAAANLAKPDAARAGQAIYRDGQLPDGSLVTAQREGGMTVSGASAACINCHRRSGLGAREGRVSVPPVAGMYLFHPRAQAEAGDNSELPYVDGIRPDRDPYTNDTLARAIREGIGQDGKPLHYLMPQYAFDDGQMASLIAYLDRLSPRTMPGADETTLHFATIVTPEADPTVRDGVLQVLDRFFDDKNHYTRSQGPRMQSSHHMMFKANRHWQLHVWKLTGPASTWERQLEQKLAEEPVFAVLASTGGSHWEPVHRFCEDAAVPCLFPIIDAPVADDAAFDNVYFSRGVLLEADLVAEGVKARGAAGNHGRVVQVFREGDAGEAAAARLAGSLVTGTKTIEAPLHRQSVPGDVANALHELHPGDIPVLWLRPRDLAALGPVPPGTTIAYLSGRMAGLEAAPLAPAWRTIARMAYPFDLPDRRKVQIDYPLGWFRLKHIPVVALQAQADAYLACIILSDTLNHMSDTFVRDYLVERIQGALGHRILTGYYPRLGLAPGQSFASKGGYLVRFAAAEGERITADTAWLTP